jgi:hypothetical protein
LGQSSHPKLRMFRCVWLLQIKGLFNESLPQFLANQSVYSGLADSVR